MLLQILIDCKANVFLEHIFEWDSMVRGNYKSNLKSTTYCIRIIWNNFIYIYFSCRFGDLDNEEYIYKEKVLAKLPEIAHRLEHFYCDKYGKDNVVIIKDSKLVEQSKLDPQKAYVQITYVEPYFDEFELRDRKTPFEQNFKLSK